jgi:hypothetical protein
MLMEITRINPQAIKMWSRWSDTPLDGSEASLRKVSGHFPALRLRPLSHL